ncbi:hypothetical protein [Photorhabdus antumapuensis]|uniref:hypothetical protein n=1 Tax=Photorhabdus antumapuensis TaxID=2862867 RepID=UPI001CEDFEFF|nr:hypothetical protein [Photorhabdus antumapuensis]MCA6220013.1 hypothetical protein [Photorhabdus antumapuensis]
MLNITNKQNNITPQLVYMWEKSHDLWRAKYCQPKFIYANPVFYQRLNLSESSDITELSTNELPSPIAEYEDSRYFIDTLFHANKAKYFALNTPEKFLQQESIIPNRFRVAARRQVNESPGA